MGAYNSYLKKKVGFDDTLTSDGSFHMIPGLKIEESIGSDETGQSYTLSECQYDCLNADTCHAISYSKERQECVRSRNSVAYDEAWDYYEKQVSVVEPFDKQKFDKDVTIER